MTQTTTPRGMRVFVLVWFGELVSLIGSYLTGFAVGVRVFRDTGSVTQFALISLFVTLPGIIVSPLAGALVDRLDRRWVMILSDFGAALGTLLIALFLFLGDLTSWHVYLAMSIASVCNAFQWPAYSAATTLLVPKQYYGRASGMVQAGEAAAQIISPLLAGILLGIIGIEGIIRIDLATFLFAVCTLLIVRFPRPEATAEGEAGKGSLLSEALYGWRYIAARPGLLGLLLFVASTNFAMSMVIVLLTPMVLGFASVAELGTVLSFGGVGMLIGSVVMSVWGGPKRRMNGIFIFVTVQGLLLLLGGLRPSVALVALAAFLFLFCAPIISGSSQAIWQSKVPPDLQGRVFAVRRMIAWSMVPLAYLLAGPLADYVFEPLLVAGGPLAGSIGQVFGVGPGRGVGVLFVILGIMTVCATLAAYLYRRLRLVEDELPDVIADEKTEPVIGTTQSVHSY